jgi:peptidoglycan/LPS O-acetylase OafA/YrhL
VDERAGRVPVADGLRGIAVLLVVAYHYWQLSFWAISIPGLPPGWDLEFLQSAGHLGVELFFLLSAFCLFHPHARGAVPSLRRYAHRRAVKIVPSYLLALVVLGVLAPEVYPAGRGPGGIGLDIGLHLTFLHDVLPETRGSFDGVMWSLAVEVQFYVVFPLLAWAFRRRPAVTAAAMVATALAYRAWVARQPLGDLEFLDTRLPAFLDVFACGMVAAHLVVRIGSRTGDAARLRPVATVAAVAASGALLTMLRWAYDVRYDAPIAVWQADNRLPAALLLLAVLVASTAAAPAWQRLLANPVLVFCSTISYNLYLWHQVLGRLVRDRGWWPAATPVPTDDPVWQWSYTLLGVAVSVLVASAITYGFERPLLRGAAGRVVARWRAGRYALPATAGSGTTR